MLSASQEKVLIALLKEKLARILAIDPGKTTGFSSFDQQNAMVARTWQKECTHNEFISELNEEWPNVIVLETFVHTHRTGVDYTPVEFIGLTKWFVERRNIILVEQTPGYGKAFFDKDKFKKMGVHMPGLPHGMDAQSHLYQFMMKYGLIDLRLLK